MSRTWDIVEDWFSIDAKITHTVTTDRRPVADVSSMLQLAVVVTLTAAAAERPRMKFTPARFSFAGAFRSGIEERSRTIRTSEIPSESTGEMTVCALAAGSNH